MILASIWLVRSICRLTLRYILSFSDLISTTILLFLDEWSWLNHTCRIFFWMLNHFHVCSLFFCRVFSLLWWFPLSINILFTFNPRILEHLIYFWLLEPCLNLFLEPPQLFLNAPVDICKTLLWIIVILFFPPLVCKRRNHFLIESLLSLSLYTQLPSLLIFLHLL